MSGYGVSEEYTEGDVHRESFYQPPIEDEDEDEDDENDDDIEMTHVVSNTSAQLAYNLALARTAAAAPGTAPASSAAAALPAKPHQDDHEDTEAPPAYSELNEGPGVGGRASGQGLQIEIHSRPTAMREYPHFDSPYGAESPSGLPLIFPDNNNTIPRRGQGTVAVVRRGDHEAADLCDADIYAIMGDLPGVTEEAALTVPGLRDPKVRKQLKNQRKYRFPYFLIAVTLVQCAMLIAEFVTYHNATGQLIDQNPFNYMIGPDTYTIVRLGASFPPCAFSMNPPYVQNDLCPVEYQNDPKLVTVVITGTNEELVCGDLQSYCGMSNFTQNPPQGDQSYRVITGLFVHAGVLHLAFNLLFQIRTGMPIEKDLGPVRMFFIYMISGVGVTMGCSGALFGIVGMLLVDIVNNWPLFSNPKRELFIVVLCIAVALGMGLLPWFSNWAHIGGIVFGILSANVFLIHIQYNENDLTRKIIMRIICLVLIILIMSGLVYALISEVNIAQICPYCHYITCLPGLPGC